MQHGNNFNAFSNGTVVRNVVAVSERSQIGAQVASPFTDQWIFRQRVEKVKQNLHHTIRSARILAGNERMN